MANETSQAATFLKNRDSWIREVIGDTDLCHPTVRVGIHLAMRMNGTRQSGAWPKMATIAKLTGVSVRGVINALKDLEGFNRKAKDWSGRRYITAERKRNVGNRYWLNFWWE